MKLKRALHEDIKELVKLLNENSVEFLHSIIEDFIKNNKVSGRLKDLADIERLSEIKG
jgi:hypothetical protein